MENDYLVITDCTDFCEGLYIDYFNNIKDALIYYSKDYNNRAIIKFEIIKDFDDNLLLKLKK